MNPERVTEIISALINQPDDTDPDPRTPLHSAALAGDNDAVELLLDTGANVETSSPGNGTPLFVVVDSKCMHHMAETLLCNGQTLNLEVTTASTP